MLAEIETIFMQRENTCRLIACAYRATWAAAILFIGLSFFRTMTVSGATVPPGFSESSVPGPWSDAVGVYFESNGRMYVWERTGKVWIKDASDNSPTLLLDISEEVGAWQD